MQHTMEKGYGHMNNAQDLQAQGVKLFGEQEYEAAARVFEQAREAYETAGDPVMAGEMMVNLGLVHRKLDEDQQALDQMQGALAIFQDANDEKRTAMTLGNMGRVYRALNDKEQAYNCYRQAADLFQALGEKQMYGDTLLAIGDLQMGERKFMAAASTYEAGYGEKDNLTARQKVIRGLNNTLSRVMGTASDKPKTDDQ